jgi:hypothetical protein
MTATLTTVLPLRDVGRVPGGVGGLDDMARAGLPLPDGVVVPVPVLRRYDHGPIAELGVEVAEHAEAELGSGPVLVRTTAEPPAQAVAVEAGDVAACVVHLAAEHPTEAIVVHELTSPDASGTVLVGGRAIEVRAGRGVHVDGEADCYVLDEHGTWLHEVTIAEKAFRLDRLADGSLVERHLDPFESRHGVLTEDEAVALAGHARRFFDWRRMAGWLDWELRAGVVTFTGWHPRR